MDPNLGTFPLLSYIMSLLPSLTPRPVVITIIPSNSKKIDIE